MQEHEYQEVRIFEGHLREEPKMQRKESKLQEEVLGKSHRRGDLGPKYKDWPLTEQGSFFH